MTWTVVAVAALALVLAVWQTVEITRVRRRVDAVPEDGNLIAALQDLAGRLGAVENLAADLDTRVSGLEARLPRAVSRTAVVAYDAFGDVAGRLSRSAAFLDAEGNGVVFSVLVARDETLFYAKEIRSGKGVERLSPEEAQAVERALAG